MQHHHGLRHRKHQSTSSSSSSSSNTSRSTHNQPPHESPRSIPRDASPPPDTSSYTRRSVPRGESPGSPQQGREIGGDRQVSPKGDNLSGDHDAHMKPEVSGRGLLSKLANLWPRSHKPPRPEPPAPNAPLSLPHPPRPRLFMLHATSHLGLVMLSFLAIFLLPLFICEIDTLAVTADPPYSTLLPDAPISHLPSPRSPIKSPPDDSMISIWHRSRPIFPLSADSIVCKPLYRARDVITRTAFAMKRGLGKVLSKAGRYTGITHMIRRIKATDLPPLPSYRLGKALVAFLYTTALDLMPPHLRLLHHSASYIQTAAIRAMAKLDVADAIRAVQRRRLAAALTQAGRQVNNVTQLDHVIDLFESGDSIDEHSTQALRHLLKAEQTDESYLLAVRTDQLAEETCTYAPSLLRLLRAGYPMGLFYEVSDNLWINTPASQLLRSDHPRSFRAAARMFGNEQMVAASMLARTVRHGTPAFESIYGKFWDYIKESSKDWSTFSSVPKFNESVLVCRAHRHGNSDPYKAVDLSYTSWSLPQREGLGVSASSGGAGSNPATVGAQSFPFQRYPQQQLLLPSRVPTIPRLNNVGGPIMYASQEFNDGMTALGHQGVKVVAADGDFRDVDAVVDIAGGKGLLLSEILKVNEHISTGILFDQASVYEGQNDPLPPLLHSALERREHGEVGCAWTQLSCPRPSLTTLNISHRQSPCVPPSATRSLLDMVSSSTVLSFPSTFLNNVAAAASALLTSKNKTSSLPISPLASPHTKAAPLPATPSPRSRTLYRPMCPNVHLFTGDFFNVSSIPSAHRFSGPSLAYKLRSVLAHRMAAAIASSPLSSLSYSSSTSPTPINYDSLTSKITTKPINLRHKTVYTLMQVVHDWKDDDCVTMLFNVRQAMTKQPDTYANPATNPCCACHHSTLMSDSPISPDQALQCSRLTLDICQPTHTSVAHSPTTASSPSASSSAITQAEGNAQPTAQVSVSCPQVKVKYQSKLMIIERLRMNRVDTVTSMGVELADLVMMNNFNDARERDIRDMRNILNRAGFVLTKVRPTRSEYVIFEAVPAEELTNNKK